MNVNHIPPDYMKDKFLRFRVTQKEHDMIMEQAFSKGYKTFSEYIRALITNDICTSANEQNRNMRISEAISSQDNK